MIIVGLISFTITVAGGSVIIFAWLCRRDIERVDHLNRWRSEFFAAAVEIVSTEAVPARVVENLTVLGEHIDHKQIGDAVLHSLRSNRDVRRMMPMERTPLDDLAPEVQQLYARAIFAFMLSVGFGDKRYGKRILQTLPEILLEPCAERIGEKAVTDLRRNDRFVLAGGLAAAA